MVLQTKIPRVPGKWISGEEAPWIEGATNNTTYTNWALNGPKGDEPNDFGSGEDYAEINPGYAPGKWNDLANDSVFAQQGIVELPLPIPIGQRVTNPNNNHSYFITDPLTGSTWTGAEAQAVGQGGHLVTINDQAEYDWLLGAFGNTNVRYWTGLNDVA